MLLISKTEAWLCFLTVFAAIFLPLNASARDLKAQNKWSGTQRKALLFLRNTVPFQTLRRSESFRRTVLSIDQRYFSAIL